MRYAKLYAAVMLIVLCLALATGCAGPPAFTGNSTSITVTDMTGRNVTVSGPVQRVVALTAADCEIVYALEAGGTVVGRGEYCDWPESALSVPSVTSGADTNVEQIIELAPQVVFMSTMDQNESQVQQLTDAGIAVVVSDAKDIAGTYESIRIIGTALGKDSAAGELVSAMQQRFTALSGKAPGGTPRQTVYFEVSPLEYGLWAAGAGSFMDEAAAILNLENIFADLSSWAEISEEQVIQRNPDIIVSSAMYFGEGPSPQEEIMARPGWQDVAAVKEGRVFLIGDNSLSRPGPRLADGAEQLYGYIYDA